MSAFPMVTPLLSPLHAFFSFTTPLYPPSPWVYVLVLLLISVDTLSFGDFVHFLASVTIKIPIIPKSVSPAQVSCLNLSMWLYFRPLKFDISQTEYIIFFIRHLLCLHSTPNLDSLTYYSKRPHYPLGLISQNLRANHGSFFSITLCIESIAMSYQFYLLYISPTTHLDSSPLSPS